MKVAIVTGAAKPDSIGHEVALRLLKEDMQVAVADLYEEGFSALRECFCVRTDVADPNSVQQMVESVMSKLKRIDVLVNCVGGSWAITREDLLASPPPGFRGPMRWQPTDESVVSHHRPRPEGQRDGDDGGERFGNGRHRQADGREEHQQWCFTAQNTDGEHDGADH